MTTAIQIQIAMNLAATNLTTLGYRVSDANVRFEANMQPKAFLGYYDTLDESYHMHHIYGDTIEEVLDNVRDFINKLPDDRTRAQSLFAKQLAKAIDTGRRTGVDMSYLNPLTAMMEKLSKNVLTYQPEAPAPVPTNSVNLYPEAPVVDFTALDEVGLAPQVIDENTTDEDFARVFAPLK